MPPSPSVSPAPGPAPNDYRCSACGYGVFVRLVPSQCPECGADAAWEACAWRPFMRNASGDSRSLAG